MRIQTLSERTRDDIISVLAGKLINKNIEWLVKFAKFIFHDAERDSEHVLLIKNNAVKMELHWLGVFDKP